ncbi:MAG: FAD-dependent oxidoreductase, partial [Cellulosilyticum sp.]|nr:FAD-dependent oxidoreductase [Cellulosilyticum sp.]
IMLGRPLLADPYWPDKVKQDKENEINHCIGDQEGCVHSFIHGGHPCCTVNPYTGFEDVKKLEMTTEPKKVAVIGAGPAGIEASKTLIDRNHNVTLFEAKSKIGGQFELNDEISIKHDVKRYLKNQRHIIEKYIDKGLILKLNTKPDIKELEENFDVVILATGVKENIPKIKGVEKVKATTAREFLENKLQLPQNTKEILVVGGGAVGCEIAYTIAKENDVQVTIVEMQKYLMNNIVHSNRSMLLWLMSGMGSTTDKVNDRLNRKVKAYTSSRVVSFKEDEALLEVNKERINPYTPWETLIPENIHNPFEKKLNDKNTEEISIKTDFVIFAMGAEENDDLYEKLKNNKKLQVYNVGDSKKLASAWEAINDANEIARGI